MAASVNTNEAADTLRKLRQRSPTKFASSGGGSAQKRVVQDTNKRPHATSRGEVETQHKKKTEAPTPGHNSALDYGLEQWQSGEKKKSPFPATEAAREVEDEGGGAVPPDKDVTMEIAAITTKNEQLQASVASLKRKFSLRGEETHQLLLGLGALNATTSELAALQKDYQERSTKNAALIQESLVQISNCSAQVDTLKRCRGLSAMQLQRFRQECTQEMNKLVARLGDLAENAYQESEFYDGSDVSAMRMSENRNRVERLKEEVREYKARFTDNWLATSSGPTQKETTERMNVALAQLDELHGEMFQLKQCPMQENQSFRRHLENLVSQQMAHTREVQDNETERVHEEMDEIRSGMCGILKDMHRLKERTKYLVPSMARVGPRISRSNPNGPPVLQSRTFGMNIGNQKDERWMNIPTANPQSTGYSLTMATRQCRDELPHYEHGYDDDCYCPGVLSSQMEARYVRPPRPLSSKSSNSSVDDDNWPMFSPDDAPATGQRAARPCESPHYSSRSSSLSGRISVYGEEHVVPNDEPSTEQFEQQLLEQHRLFWIGEGAG